MKWLVLCFYPSLERAYCFVEQESVSEDDLFYQERKQVLFLQILLKSSTVNHSYGFMKSEIRVELFVQPEGLHNSAGISQPISFN